jgi:hypothetical protein
MSACRRRLRIAVASPVALRVASGVASPVAATTRERGAVAAGIGDPGGLRTPTSLSDLGIGT